jgi:hypothetical protein
MAVSVEPDTLAGVRVGIPRELFATRIRFITATDNAFSYSPDRAGDRFLVNVLAHEGLPTVNVITHWQQAVGVQASEPLR